MVLSKESLREAVGGQYIDIEYRRGISCICKETAVPGADPFNRMVDGELISGPIVFVHTNPDGSYSSLTEKELRELRLKFAAPLIDAGREMGSTYGLLNTARISKSSSPKITRVAAGQKEAAVVEPVVTLTRNGDTTEKRRLFVDMDGTLAEFGRVNTLETLYEPEYFLMLKPQENVLHAVKNLAAQGDVEVFVLTAYLSDSPYARTEKNMWMNLYLPEIDASHRLFVPCGADKRECIPGGIRPADCLLDDYTHNLTQWESSARGIKLLNGINHTHGTWQHDRVWYGREPEDLAEKILDVIQERGHVYDADPEAQKEDLAKQSFPSPKNLETALGHDVLFDAVLANDGEKVDRWLVKHKDDANKLIDGATPLHHAVEHGADKSAAALLTHGAYVDAINAEQKTPLFRAVERGDEKMVRQLLKAGANPEISDGKQFIQDVGASKTIKSMLDDCIAAKDVNLGKGLSSGFGKGRGRH